ncbi:MAG: methionyl-tRNA formyltransferase [Planctomycetota bacterium]|jgi:methionyl-tRNA formyltransferase
MRILFLGSGAFGLPSLQALSEHHDVVGVVSQPDRPAGRGRTPTPTPISRHALDLEIAPLIRPASINEPSVIERLHELDADAWIVIAFGQKLSRELLREQFAFNLHASLLPRWRGAAPINASIVAQDERVGNTIITIAERMDAGAILTTQSIERDPMWNAGELHERLSAMGGELVLDTLGRHRAGALTPAAQDESLVTLAPKMKKSDGWIDFDAHARACQARIHGLTPWPGVGVTLDGKPLKISRARVPDERTDLPAGTLIDADRGIVACGEGSVLELLEIQPPGKRIMEWAPFARGRSLHAGVVLAGSQPPC